MSGTAIAQIIAIGLTPFVTRLYGAEAYGTYALFISLVSILTVIACLRYELSIMLPDIDDEAADLFALCLFIVTIFSISIALIMWVFGGPLLQLVNATELLPYAWLIGPMILLGGYFLALNYWISRARRFKYISNTQIVKSAFTSGTQLSSGIAGYASSGGLIGASVVGQTAATSVMGYQVWKSDKWLLGRSISWQGMFRGAKQYIKFPKYDIWSALINVISLQLPIILLTTYFSTSIAGYYSLSISVLQAPTGLIGGAIAQVFFQRAAQVKNQSKDKLAFITKETVRRLIVIGFLPMLLLSVIGNDLFIVTFGDAWGMAGTVAQIVSFSIFFNFIYSPISTLYTVQNKLRSFLFFNILLIIARIGSLMWGGVNKDIYLGLILMSLFGGLIYFYFSYWILKELDVSVIGLLNKIKKTLFLGIMLFMLISLIKYFFVPTPIILVFLSVLVSVSYYVVLLAEDPELKSYFKKMINLHGTLKH